jgi:uncharacterized lipoprotein YajG
MKKELVILGSLFFLIGCATARLGTGPEVYSLVEYPSTVRVGVAKAVDARGTDSAGTIGACGIKIKDDELSTLATNYLLDGLNRQVKTNTVRVEKVSSENVSQLAAEHNVVYIVIAKISELKMFSADAIMQPVQVDCIMDLEIFDKTGRQVFHKSFAGAYQERIGLSIVDKATGRLAERAVKDAVANLVKDPELQRILQSKQ